MSVVRLFLLVLWMSIIGGLALASGAAEEATPIPASTVLAAQADTTPTSTPATGKADWEVQWENTLAEARQEGVVNVYGPPGTAERDLLVNDFQAAFPGIRVELVQGYSGRLLSKIRAERSAGQYLADVFVGGTSNVVTVMKEGGIVQPLTPALILPQVKDLANWRENRLLWADAQEPYVDLMFEASVSPFLVYNTNVVNPADFSSYWDLVDPKWKGKVVSTDIRKRGPGGVTSRFIVANPKLGPDYLRKVFGTLDVRLSSDQRQIVDWVVRGVYPIGIFVSAAELIEAAKLGLPVADLPYSRLKEGGVLGPGVGSVALFDRAPHEAAAKVFINWLLTKEAQELWQRKVLGASWRSDVSYQGLPKMLVPEPGVRYENGGTEFYSRQPRSAATNAINEALGE